MKRSAIVAGNAKPLGKYPHFKRAGDFIYVSGTSARLPDGTIGGVTLVDGQARCDVVLQTRCVLENIRRILASAGAQLSDCVDIVCFLVDMADFDAYNQVYGEYFDAHGPTRTTVAVRALPHPHMVVEMKAIAHLPDAQGHARARPTQP